MHYYADSRYDTYPPEKKTLIGNREKLTPADMKMILDMYQCKANATTTCGGNAEGTAAEGKACMFPFTYKGTSYFSCTSVNHDQPWCYTTKDWYWGNCNCPTCGGNAEGTAAEGKACMFPFTYKGTSYF